MLIKFEDDNLIEQSFNIIDDENITIIVGDKNETIQQDEVTYKLYTSHMHRKEILKFEINKYDRFNDYHGNINKCYECDEERIDGKFILANKPYDSTVCYCEECFNNMLMCYKITDFQALICQGFYSELRSEDYEKGVNRSIPYAYDMLSRIFDVSADTCYEAIGRIHDYGWLDFGTSLRGAWLDGDGIVYYQLIKEYWNHSKKYGRVETDEQMTVFEMTLNKNLTDEELQGLFSVNKIINVKV